MPWNRRLKRRAIALSAFVTVLVLGCSTYTPQRQIVAKEDLAKYNPKDFGKAASVKRASSVEKEDEWIVKAIWFEQQNNFKESNRYYKKLYDSTHKDEYLLKELKTALYSGVTSDHIEKLENYIAKHPDNIVAKRLLLSSHLYAKKYEKAKSSTLPLLEKSTQAIDFELSANPYIFTKEYSRAVELLTEAYNKTYNEDILLKIVTILVNYQGDVPEAITRLETHRSSRGCSEKICLQLVDIYLQQGNITQLLSVYEDLYESTQKEVYAEKAIESYLYLKDHAGAVLFLQTKYKNPEMLYSLYVDTKDYSKAYALTQQLISTTSDPKWYAEAGITLYESASNKDDKEMLGNVVELFEKAFKNGAKNSVYLNYYGYTLIDKDIDVEKGISIIKKALEQEPDNSYYLDSLAWGYYKLHQCTEALSVIKKVVDIEGLDEVEIVEHWNTINQNCKKEKEE